ncbi:MAG: transporter substrate-binding domain-containing protein [Actinomycetota bacterium]|jgi:polar amino acid transport system substrate-binding protein|nr:transporter substrate-binding domain-containing protein [Actinomycetota bacterium]
MKTKRTALAVILAMVMAFAMVALAGCGKSSSSSSSSATPTAQPTGEELIVGFDQEYPPYGYIANDGSYTGFDLDLAQEVCNRLGWTYKAMPIDWDSKDAQLNADTISCIWNGFTMEGREGQYAFSEPYMLNEQVIVVKADSGIQSLSDLEGKIVMTQTESAAQTVLEDEEGQKALADTFQELQTIGDYNSAFMNLESGSVDAVACDLSIAAYQLSANPGKYTQLGESLSSEHYAVGFKLGNEEKAQKVTDTLKAMYADGTVAKIIDKYADQGMTIDNWVLK